MWRDRRSTKEIVRVAELQMHSALNLWCVSGLPLSQLLGGAAVSKSCYQLGLIAAPPSSWDKGCPVKHHIGNVGSATPNIRSLTGTVELYAILLEHQLKSIKVVKMAFVCKQTAVLVVGINNI